MRMGLLCALTLLLAAELVHAQPWPAAPGMYPGFGPPYPMNPAAPYPRMNSMWSVPAGVDRPAAAPVVQPPVPGQRTYSNMSGNPPYPTGYPMAYPGQPQRTNSMWSVPPGVDRPSPAATPAPVAQSAKPNPNLTGNLPQLNGYPMANPGQPQLPNPGSMTQHTPQPPVAIAPPTIVAPPITLMPAPCVPMAPPPNWFLAGPHWVDPGDYSPGPCDEPIRFHRECKERLWFHGDFLLAFFRDGPLNVPLVSTGSAGDPSPGALGQPGTTVLYGNNKVDFDQFQGFRLEAGLFLDHDARFSVDLSGFFLLPQHVIFEASSSAAGNPVLGRPVINALNNAEESFAIALPDTFAGGVRIDARSQLFGGEVNGRVHGYCGRRLHSQALLGFRILRLEESLRITDRLQPLQPNVLTFLGNPVNAPNTLEDQDYFTTSNTFYGFQLGWQVRYEQDWFFADAYTKTGLGVTDQQANIAGSTSLVSPTGGQIAQGGVLALPTNIGEYNRHVFGVVPQAGVDFGINLSQHLRVKAGYSFLLMNNAARPGLFVDRTVNPTQVPSDILFGTSAGPARPTFSFRDQVFWAHVFNFGLEFDY